jgi:hypothetical protein
VWTGLTVTEELGLRVTERPMMLVPTVCHKTTQGRGHVRTVIGMALRSTLPPRKRVRNSTKLQSLI